MIKKDELYLITGGTGVVGESLCDRILQMGGKVRIFSRSQAKLLKLKEQWDDSVMYSNIEIIVGDVTNKRDVASSFKDVKGVFHLAALAQSMQSGGASDSIKTNVIGSMNVLEQSLKTPVEFLLGVSSDKAVQVSGPYGATKFLMERLFDEYQEKNKDVKYRVVRMGNVIYSIDSVLYKWKSLIEREIGRAHV